MSPNSSVNAHGDRHFLRYPYNTLMPMVEKQTIGNLLAEFVQTRFAHRTYSQAELEDGYKAMAADEEYEREAKEWCNGLEFR